METEATYTAEKKKIMVTQKVTPAPTNIHLEISVPFFSKGTDIFFKIVNEDLVIVIQTLRQKQAFIASWSSNTTYYQQAITSTECSEEEFRAAYFRAESLIKSLI